MNNNPENYPENNLDYQKVYKAGEVFPLAEMNNRIAKLQSLLQEQLPQTSGVLIFSRLNIYYFTGTLGQGCLWVPSNGEPVLALRKGNERARLESPIKNIASYRSFKELESIFARFEVPLSKDIAAEKGWLPWSLAENLEKYLSGTSIKSADRIIEQCRSVKSEWELQKLRISGQKFYEAQAQRMPEIIKIGMSELDIAHKTWEIMFKLGHGGTIRMKPPEENLMLGLVCIGKNGNYPSYYNGPLGHMAEHPALPYMGNKSAILQKGDLIAADFCFCYEGYLTDRTQIYFAGKESELPSVILKAQELSQQILEKTAQMLKIGAIPSEIYAKSLEMAAPFKSGYMGIAGGQVPFLGHSIGLQVDEFPAIAANFNEPLQENMVFALEPKIGLAAYGMVGVEDTYEITAQGAVSLTGLRQAMDIICLD